MAFTSARVSFVFLLVVSATVFAEGAGLRKLLVTEEEVKAKYAGQDPDALANRLNDAAKANEVVKVKALLVLGASPNGSPNSVNKPLDMAASFGSLEAAEILIQNGAIVDLENQYSKGTPLNSAALSGYPELVQLLLDNGADINHQSIDGNTPLIGASMGSHLNTVEVLVARGADKTITNNEGKTALEVVGERGPPVSDADHAQYEALLS